MLQHRSDDVTNLGAAADTQNVEAILWPAMPWLKALLISLVPELLLLTVAAFGLSWGLQALQLWLSMRALRQRRSMAVLATARYREVDADAVHTFARALSMVRIRFLKWLLRPASAVRFRIDAIGGQGAVFSVTGPTWMRSVLEVGSFHGCQLTELEALDFTLMTPKGMRLGWDDDGDDLLQDTPPQRLPLGLAGLVARSAALEGRSRQ